MDYRPASFSYLEGWRDDDQRPAFSAFIRSCTKISNLAPEAPVNPRELRAADQPHPWSGYAEDWSPRLRCC